MGNLNDVNMNIHEYDVSHEYSCDGTSWGTAPYLKLACCVLPKKLSTFEKYILNSTHAIEILL